MSLAFESFNSHLVDGRHLIAFLGWGLGLGIHFVFPAYFVNVPDHEHFAKIGDQPMQTQQAVPCGMCVCVYVCCGCS